MTAAARPNPRWVRIFLAEKGINTDRTVDFGTLQHRSNDYKAINPMRPLPTPETTKQDAKKLSLVTAGRAVTRLLRAMLLFER